MHISQPTCAELSELIHQLMLIAVRRTAVGRSIQPQAAASFAFHVCFRNSRADNAGRHDHDLRLDEKQYFVKYANWGLTEVEDIH